MYLDKNFKTCFYLTKSFFPSSLEVSSTYKQCNYIVRRNCYIITVIVLISPLGLISTVDSLKYILL